MTPLTKQQRRRYLLLEEHWLKFHGDPSRPKFAARQARKALGIRP